VGERVLEGQAGHCAHISEHMSCHCNSTRCYCVPQAVQARGCSLVADWLALNGLHATVVGGKSESRTHAAGCSTLLVEDQDAY
jgi:hypothetical protein